MGGVESYVFGFGELQQYQKQQAYPVIRFPVEKKKSKPRTIEKTGFKGIRQSGGGRKKA